MAQYNVTFIADIVVDETIEADSIEAALDKAQEMIDAGEVGEHGLRLDWEVSDEPTLIKEEPDNTQTGAL